MNAMPSPEEADRALRDVERRRLQSRAAAAWPRWCWVASGMCVAVYGVLLDRHVLNAWGSLVPIALAALGLVSRTRWGSTIIGRPVRRPAGSLLPRWAIGLLAVGLIALALAAGFWPMPHLSLVFSVVAGLLLAIAGPWWQNLDLSRRPRT